MIGQNFIHKPSRTCFTTGNNINCKKWQSFIKKRLWTRFNCDCTFPWLDQRSVQTFPDSKVFPWLLATMPSCGKCPDDRLTEIDQIFEKSVAISDRKNTICIRMLTTTLYKVSVIFKLTGGSKVSNFLIISTHSLWDHVK